MKNNEFSAISITFNAITGLVNLQGDDYICLNNLLAFFPKKRLQNWRDNQSTKDFIEILNNKLNDTSSNQSEFKNCIVTIEGKRGGTFAHRLLAIEFLTWLSPEFKLLVLMEWDSWNKSQMLKNEQIILNKETFREMLQSSLKEFMKKFATKKELQAMEAELTEFAKGLNDLLFEPILARLDRLEEKQKRIENKLLELSPPQYGYVYVLYNPVNEEYKIGQSNQPNIRTKTFKSLDPRIELKILLTFESIKQSLAMEKFLHHQFEKKCTHGEWFKLDGEDLVFITSLREVVAV